MTERKQREELFVEIASLVSKRATCCRLQVGAIITKDNRIISSGYNGPLKGELHCSESTCNSDEPCKRSMHAEANAIAYAAKEGIALSGTTIWCTHQPCLKCSELIISAGIVSVNYVEPYRDNSGIELLVRHRVKINKINGV